MAGRRALALGSRRLGQIGRISKGVGGNKDDEVSSGVPCIRYGDLYTTHDFVIRKSRSFVPNGKAAQYTAIEFGDVLFAGSGETIAEIGKSAVNLMRQDARCGGDVIIFRPRKPVDARYFGYTLDSHPVAGQKASMGRGFTIMHIYGSQLKYLSMPLPPLAEQTSIAHFLDRSVARIQRYVNAKQKLITLLDEQKRAMISQVVTGQIDVRTGKPYAAYRPSRNGSPRKVPAHWEVRRF